MMLKESALVALVRGFCESTATETSLNAGYSGGETGLAAMEARRVVGVCAGQAILDLDSDILARIVRRSVLGEDSKKIYH